MSGTEPAIDRLRAALAEYDSQPMDPAAFGPSASLRSRIVDAARAVVDEYDETVRDATARARQANVRAQEAERQLDAARADFRRHILSERQIRGVG